VCRRALTNAHAAHETQGPYCAGSTCPVPILGVGQVVVGGCAEGGAIGAPCDIGCDDGYTASAVQGGTCAGLPNSSSAAYQGQLASCAPNPCEAPLPTSWVERSLNGE